MIKFYRTVFLLAELFKRMRSCCHRAFKELCWLGQLELIKSESKSSRSFILSLCFRPLFVTKDQDYFVIWSFRGLRALKMPSHEMSLNLLIFLVSNGSKRKQSFVAVFEATFCRMVPPHFYDAHFSDGYFPAPRGDPGGLAPWLGLWEQSYGKPD